MRGSGRLGLFALAAAAATLAAMLVLPASRGQPASAAPATSMDQPIALLAEARDRLRRVADYECTLIKRERVQGQLQPEQVMTMKARNQPYSVDLLFEGPDSVRGQEVCFVAGRNKGMMRVHPAGWLGIIGFVSIETRDPRAFKDNRHPITEAALWSVMDATARYWEAERRVNKTRVRIEERRFQERPCVWIETTHPDRNAMPYYAYRCVLCLDKETRLPVRIEAYDWPRPSGPDGGELLECYSYLNLRCNTGLAGSAFDH